MKFTEHTIVIPKDAHFDVKSAAMKLQNFFKEFAFVTLPIVTDGQPAVEKEILMGKVDRPESATVKIDTWHIRVKGEKLVFDAVHYYPLNLAVEAFIKEQKILLAPDFKMDGQTDVPMYWGKHKLVWNDEFDGKTLDVDKWTGRANMSMPDAVLSMRPGIVDVEDGNLVMTTRILDRSNPYARYETNFSITTADTMNYKYGYLEIRAKVPHYAMGEWPSFWMVSGNSELGKKAWREAHNGEDRKVKYGVEVDIFEIFSNKYHVIPNLHKWYARDTNFLDGNGNRIGHQQLSGIDQGSSKSGTRAYMFTDEEDPNGWHTYGFLWTPTEMSFSVDGDFYYSYDLRKNFGHPDSGMEDYDQPLDIIFNNMLFTEGYKASPSGAWAPNAIPDTPEGADLFPLTYTIDYCRLYQLEGEGEIFLPEEPGHGVLTDPNSPDRSHVPPQENK